MDSTTQQIADLDAAIASGVRSVAWNGVRTSFRSVRDMLRLRSQLVAKLIALPVKPVMTLDIGGDQ